MTETAQDYNTLHKRYEESCCVCKEYKIEPDVAEQKGIPHCIILGRLYFPDMNTIEESGLLQKIFEECDKKNYFKEL
ncbi:MAG: hypothetical protein WC413_00120 [Candidatus Nanoarchaeia archaeon]